MEKNSMLIAIVGPSASGKTTIARKLAAKLGKNRACIISQDQYYKDWSKKSYIDRCKINFDHPDSFDFKLLEKHINELKKGKTIYSPKYSYCLHTRLKQKIRIEPKSVIIAEGLFLFIKKNLCDLFDLKVYLDIDKATSLSRRIRRDLQCRGESIDSVCRKYFGIVLPMQEEYMEKQKRSVDIVINDFASNNVINKILRNLNRIR